MERGGPAFADSDLPDSTWDIWANPLPASDPMNVTLQAICFGCFAAMSKLCYVHGCPSMMLLNPFSAAVSRWTCPCRNCFSSKKPYHKQLDSTSVPCSAGECPRVWKGAEHRPTHPHLPPPPPRLESCLFSTVSWAKDLHLTFSLCFLDFLMSNQNLSLQLDMTKCLVPERIPRYFTELLPAVHFPSIIKAVLVFLTCLDIHLHDICRNIFIFTPLT